MSKWLGIAALLCGVAALAVAQPKKRVLHEDLPPPSAGSDRMIGAEPGAGKNPAAVAAGSKLLPEPELAPPNRDEPVLGRGGFAADRDTRTRPDLSTGQDGTLHYVSVFNPDVIPFKRMSAFDAVADDYTLSVQRTATTELEVGGDQRGDRERFWGSVLIELSPGVEAPLPSVAPDMRILSYEAEPAITLRFSKDGADNFFVRSDESSARGVFRLVFLVDADPGYFAPALPATNLTMRRVAELAPPDLRRSLPGVPAKTASRVLERILSLSPGQPLESTFNSLVLYFRAFEAKPSPTSSGDIYWDLTENQAGVCRHRSFAFMVTATALGLPTRYVTNEAHAFVEVWFPTRGWQRLDLGGAALRMDVTGGKGKTIHRPRAEDPFAKPPSYKQSYTQLSGEISGLTPDQIAERRAGTAEDPWSPPSDFDGANDTVGPGQDTQPQRPPDPNKLTPSLSLTSVDASAYRGESLHIEGRVDGPQGPVAQLRIDVFLAVAGRNGQDASLVGRSASGADGRFAVDVEVPASLAPATYEVFVSTPGDVKYNAAVSN